MEALILTALIGGTVTAGVAAYQQGQAAEDQAEMQAQIAERNALMAERAAEEERMAAREEAKRHEREGEVLMARQRAGFAKAGVGVGRGTPLSVVVKTAEELEADRLMILREGRLAAERRRQEAGIYGAEGSAAKARGRAAGRGATLSATGTILSGLGQAGYYKSQMSSPKNLNTYSKKANKWLTDPNWP